MSEDEYESKKTVVKLNVNEDAIADRIMDKMQTTSDNEKVQTALRYFDRDKSWAQDQYPDFKDEIESCETPKMLHELIDSLEQYQIKDELEQRKKVKPKPMGKARMEASKTDSKDMSSYVDGLYNTMLYDKSTTKRKEAEAKVNQLLQSFVDGKSFKQLSEGKSLNKYTARSTCPVCGAMLTEVDMANGTCPQCLHEINAYTRMKGTDKRWMK